MSNVRRDRVKADFDAIRREPGVDVTDVDHVSQSEQPIQNAYLNLSDSVDVERLSYRSFARQFSTLLSVLELLPCLYAIDIMSRAHCVFRRRLEICHRQLVSMAMTARLLTTYYEQNHKGIQRLIKNVIEPSDLLYGNVTSDDQFYFTSLREVTLHKILYIYSKNQNSHTASELMDAEHMFEKFFLMSKNADVLGIAKAEQVSRHGNIADFLGHWEIPDGYSPHIVTRSEILYSHEIQYQRMSFNSGRNFEQARLRLGFCYFLLLAQNKRVWKIQNLCELLDDEIKNLEKVSTSANYSYTNDNYLSTVPPHVLCSTLKEYRIDLIAGVTSYFASEL